MSEIDFGAIADATEQIVAMVAGFKAKMVEVGFSVKISEAASLEFLKMLLNASTSK